MNSGHQNAATEESAEPAACSARARETRFNALDVLARLPDLSRDQPLPYSRSSRTQKKRPREVSLRLLGGSVVGLFVLAIAIPYFWGGPKETWSPPKGAAASFESDSTTNLSDADTRPDSPDVTPIIQPDTAQTDASAGPTVPLDATELEKQLGVLRTKEPPANPSGAPIQPFVVGEGVSSEPVRTTEPVPAPRRPLAPRFEDTHGALAASGSATPWNQDSGPYSNPNTLDRAAQNPESSADFTPWQPGMTAGRDAMHPRPTDRQPPVGREPAYTPWSGTGGPAPPADGPAPRGPAYTAMTPTPSHTPAAPTDTPTYQNPPPVWNPGNPYVTPNPASGGVSPVRTPYQQ